MDLHEFNRHVREQRARSGKPFVVPVARRLSADLLTPVSAYLLLRQGASYAFLLESVEGGEKLGRYSFIGRNPYRSVRAFGNEVTIEDLNETGEVLSSRTETASVYDALHRLMDQYTEVRLPDLPRFTGGAVGYMGYDTIRLIERLPEPLPDPLSLPDAVWFFYRSIVAFDHVKHQIILISSVFVEDRTDIEQAFADAVERNEALERELSSAFDHPEPVTLTGTEFTSNVSREAFEEAVEQARRYIYEGDIFQVVLSQRFSIGFTGDRFNLYRALRQVNPSPYLFYLDFEEFALVGSSPEVLVRVEDGRAEVLPIAGTRPRGATPEQDRQHELDLMNDPKERAEHLMLVDLGRNDLGRVCEYDSVHVSRYAAIERYSHVMHLVSSVAGRLKPTRTALDVLAAGFPAGTVSGAPKVRAMEIINELERVKRGIYAGAVGYVDFSGNLDTCIAIRTMLVRDGLIYVQAGAGIVAESDPAREFEETVNKARALKEAILVAADGLL